MKALRKRFGMNDYNKVDDYFQAIADLLTNLGPERVIGIQTPGTWHLLNSLMTTCQMTDVWYWEK